MQIKPAANGTAKRHSAHIGLGMRLVGCILPSRHSLFKLWTMSNTGAAASCSSLCLPAFAQKTNVCWRPSTALLAFGCRLVRAWHHHQRMVVLRASGTFDIRGFAVSPFTLERSVAQPNSSPPALRLWIIREFPPAGPGRQLQTRVRSKDHQIGERHLDGFTYCLCCSEYPCRSGSMMTLVPPTFNLKHIPRQMLVLHRVEKCLVLLVL